MGNFAHKFNTRDIKPKLARRAKEITCKENEPKKNEKKKLFIQTLFDSWVHLVAYNSLEMLYIQPEEQLSAFYYEESLLFPLLLITKFSAVYVYSCEHLLAACRIAYANCTDTLTYTLNVCCSSNLFLCHLNIFMCNKFQMQKVSWMLFIFFCCFSKEIDGKNALEKNWMHTRRIFFFFYKI